MVDYNYYVNTYKGDTMDSTLFDKLELRASDLINYLTSNAEVTDNIKKAACAEIEFLNANGGANAVNGKDTTQYVSESIGSYSYSKGESKSIKYINGLPIAPMVKLYIGNKGGAFINVG